MSRRAWVLAAVLWAGLMVALVIYGEKPILATSAAAGIVLLVANAERIWTGRPHSLLVASAPVPESLLGAALLTFTIVGGFVPGGMAQTLILAACVITAAAAIVTLLLRAARA